MRAAVAALALLAGCLSAPPDSVGNGDGGGGTDVDAASGPDAAIGACPTRLDLPLTDEADFAGWAQASGAFCTDLVTELGLQFTNSGQPSVCSRHVDQVVDLTGGRLRVRLYDGGDANLSMTFSVVVGSPEVPFNDRKWLYFERDQGQLLFGQCNGDEFPGTCNDAYWGYVAYDPSVHHWLSFSRQADEDTLVLETSEDGEIFEVQGAAGGVPPADALCVGIDLGSYEVQASGSSAYATFGNLRTD